MATETDDRLFRILIPDFNMFINESKDEQKATTDVIRLLRNLKALIRSLNGVCLITVDEDLLPKRLANHLTYLADAVYKLTSFKDHQEIKIGDYDGTVKLIKQPKLHGLICTLSEFDIYALRLKGKTGILVEKIHLEPEEDRS